MQPRRGEHLFAVRKTNITLNYCDVDSVLLKIIIKRGIMFSPELADSHGNRFKIGVFYPWVEVVFQLGGV